MARVSQLLLEVGDAGAVEAQRLLDECHVLNDDLLVGRFGVFLRHAAFSLIDLAEAFADLLDGLCQVFRLRIALCQHPLQGVDDFL